LVLAAQTWAPPQFMVKAEESADPPVLVIEACSQL
jgi:hypothetical protein